MTLNDLHSEMCPCLSCVRAYDLLKVNRTLSELEEKELVVQEELRKVEEERQRRLQLKMLK